MENLRELLFALIIFSGVLIGLANFSSDLLSSYGVAGEDITDLEVTSAVESHVETLKESIENTQLTGVAILDVPLTIASGAYNTLKLLFTSTNLYLSLLGGISEILPIPGWVITTIMGCLSIFIIFEIVSAIMKYKV